MTNEGFWVYRFVPWVRFVIFHLPLGHLSFAKSFSAVNVFGCGPAPPCASVVSFSGDLRFLWGRGHRTRGRSGSRMGRVIYRVICLNDLLGGHQASIDPGAELRA